MFKRIENIHQPARRRSVVVAVMAILAATCAQSLYADDPKGQQGADPQAQDLLQLLKEIQTLQGASGEQAIMQDGFAVGETLGTVAGQPEVAVGLKLLQSVLDFTGVFGSSSSTTAAAQALATLTRGLAEVTSQVANLQNAVNKLNVNVVQIVNQAKVTALLQAQTDFSGFKDQLYPNSHVLNGAGTTPQRLNGASDPASQPVDRATAGKIASQIAQKLNLFVDNEAQYFIGDDVQVIPAVYGPKDPTSGNPPLLITPRQTVAAPGLKPNPGLTVYLFGVQLWITALEIESAGTDSGHNGIKQDKATQALLAKHIAFLRSKAKGGADSNMPETALCDQLPAAQRPSSAYCTGPIQDRIVKAVSCQWSVHGGTIGSNYPNKQGVCSASLGCKDDLAHSYPKIPPVSITWTQQDQNSLCTLDQQSQPLTGGVGLDGKALSRPLPFPSQLAASMENVLQQQYGLMAMDRMAGMLSQVSLYGTAVQGTGPDFQGNFGTKDDAPFFVYAVDGSGAVKNYTGFRNQPLPPASSAGTIADIKTLISGGDKTFYALTKDGKLNWYRFTPAVKSGGAQPAANTVAGPTNIATGFGAYKQVFGGSDGVIYAVQSDGTLMWYRHAGFANGGGASTMTGPKAVGAGFGQYKSVFSAGDGIIYAIAQDGSLLWFRHKNYLTGVADAAPGNNSGNAKNTGVVANKYVMGPSQLEGPVTVGSGWGAFRQVIPSGDGVVLALQNDGKLLWYRHADYLTGVSTSPPPSSAGSNTSVQNSAAAAAWGAQSGASAAQPVSPGNKALAASWGAPVQVANTNAGNASAQHATGAQTPQWGSAQTVPRAGTGAPVMSGSLHPGESLQTVHAGTTSPSLTSSGGSTGIGARQNVGSANAMVAMIGTPHWQGPATIDAHSGWEGFPEIAAVLPVTVQTNVIK